jgi:predicted Rossmann fold nucleotide-binding protein DprA/Smf involved in DNA uptake
MDGALSSDGTAVGIMADRLSQAVVARDSREWIRENRLALISPFDPSAGFNVGNAMARNKLIYAFADAALVMNSDFQKGGTWAGAIEQIKHYRACPVFVRTTGEVPNGNLKLVDAGAQPWPEPGSPQALDELLQSAARQQFAKPESESLLPGLRIAEDTLPPAPKPLPIAAGSECSPAQTVIAAVQTALREHLTVPMAAKEIATLFDVQPKQADLWLARFCEEGWIRKTKKPVRYTLAESPEETLFSRPKSKMP